MDGRTMAAAATLGLCLMLVSFAGEPTAGKDQPRSFPLPQHGTLILNLPGTWKQAVRQPPYDLPPTITFAPDQGDEFKVLITPIWSPKKDPAFNGPEKLKSLVERELGKMLPGAVEKEVPVLEIKGASASGYYFLVTDKAPNPGEYPHAVRASVGVGDLLLSVTILCRTKDTEGITATLKALQEAKQGSE